MKEVNLSQGSDEWHAHRELIDDLRSRINPDYYAAYTGMDSYERRLCAVALEAQAAEIELLREWIRNEGERNNTCTFSVLGEVCGYCQCKRKPSKDREKKER